MDPIVEVKDLTKKFGDFTAVDKISFSVGKGEIFGFLGPNGAGKSTTIKILCGIMMPTSGEGRVSGYDIITQQNEIKNVIGYMSQRFSLYEDLTIREAGGCLLDRFEWVRGISPDFRFKFVDFISQEIARRSCSRLCCRSGPDQR